MRGASHKKSPLGNWQRYMRDKEFKAAEEYLNHLLATTRSIKEAAEIAQVTLSHFYDICRRYGIEWGSLGAPPPPTDIEALTYREAKAKFDMAYWGDLVRKHNKIAIVAVAAGQSYRYVREILYRLGLETSRPRGPRRGGGVRYSADEQRLKRKSQL